MNQFEPFSFFEASVLTLIFFPIIGFQLGVAIILLSDALRLIIKNK